MVLEAFRLANRAMAMAARQRRAMEQGIDPDQADPPEWRPFQLAFILMNLRAIVEPAHTDRELVDLLFFPTGGGKTEAYLGLAAFAILLRRLRDPDVTSAGVTVLMRYTLRLLTLDQLGRAATLICALELLRQKVSRALGTWPFEIGLWVGKAATPNRMGQVGETDRTTARAKTIAFQNNSRKAPPVPVETLSVVRRQAEAELIRPREHQGQRQRPARHESSGSAPAPVCEPEMPLQGAERRCRSSRSTSRSIAASRAS